MAGIPVFGVYSNLQQVDCAVEEMKREGFCTADLSVLFPRNEGTDDFSFDLDNRGLEGAAAGAASGAILGSVLGWLSGVGAVAIPSLDPYLGHGPIISLLSGAVVSATVGGLAGGVTGTAISAWQTWRRRGRSRSNSILLSVQCDNLELTRRARNILELTGGRDIAGAHELECGNAIGDGARTIRETVQLP